MAAYKEASFRVLFLTDGLACGGKERQLVELATGLVRTGRCPCDSVAVVSMEDRGYFDGPLEEAGIAILRVPRRWRWDPLLPIRLAKVIREFRPDILHSFSLMATFYAGLTPKPSRCKLVDGCIRDAFPRRGLKERIMYAIAFTMADMVVANTEAGLKAKRAPARKRKVLLNGFDFRRLEHLRPPVEVRAELAIGDGPVVGMVAGFSKFKDWDSFFEAARLVRERKPEVTFVAVGDGESLPRYQAKYGQDAGVVFAGRRFDVEDVENVFDIGVLSSFIEGVPNVVMEYMALGMPVVVTDCGGVSELVQSGVTGFFVPPGDPPGIAERLIRLLCAPAEAKAIGAAGRNRIRGCFSMGHALENLLGFYENVTGPKSCSA